MVMWLQGTEDETEPAGVAGLFDGLSEAERRAVMIALFLLSRCPLTENACHDRLDVVRQTFELVGH
jgi:hypothetical protein